VAPRRTPSLAGRLSFAFGFTINELPHVGAYWLIGAPNHVAALAVGRSDVDGIGRRIAEQGPPHGRLEDQRHGRRCDGTDRAKRTCTPARVALARSKTLDLEPPPRSPADVLDRARLAPREQRERIAGQSERILPLELQPERLAREPLTLVLDLAPEPRGSPRRLPPMKKTSTISGGRTLR
jgi:hypothetical protein